MFDTAFDRIYKALRRDEDLSTELDWAEQASWVLFLKYLHDSEIERADAAELEGKPHAPILDPAFSWGTWAYPSVNGQLDDDKAKIGDDLIEFVKDELFPYLANLKSNNHAATSIQYKIGEVFSGIRCRYNSGYILRDVIEQVNSLEFNAQSQRHELSDLYETRIKNMGNSGRNGGEYYTPRPLIRAMIKVTDPKIGETIYDGAVGSAGFLCEAFEYLNTPSLSASQYELLQTKTLYGQEKKPLAFIIGTINMILHGIDSPNIVRGNTLAKNVNDIQESERHDIVLANPPFGGESEDNSVKLNFPIQSGEAAYLFLQHFIRKLKVGGRAAVVIKNTFLSNGDAKALREELTKTCNVHTILDCPQGTFQGAGVKTVVLFFEKGKATKDVFYYQLNPGRNLGKTNPLNDNDLSEFVSLQKDRTDSENSWVINLSDIDRDSFDLSPKNPNAPEKAPLRLPEEIIEDMLTRDKETADILEKIRGML